MRRLRTGQCRGAGLFEVGTAWDEIDAVQDEAAYPAGLDPEADLDLAPEGNFFRGPLAQRNDDFEGVQAADREQRIAGLDRTTENGRDARGENAARSRRGDPRLARFPLDPLAPRFDGIARGRQHGLPSLAAGALGQARPFPVGRLDTALGLALGAAQARDH